MGKVLKFIGQSILAMVEGIILIASFLILVAAIILLGVAFGPAWAIVAVLVLLLMGWRK